MFGLQADEWQSLLLSLKTHRKHRRLSPYNVAILLDRALASTDVQTLAQALGFRDTTTLRRIHRLHELRPELGTLVRWGARRGYASMSTASELLRLEDTAEVEDALRAMIENDLTKEEARQVVQIRRRSGRPIPQCVSEALLTRPRIERQELIMGAVLDAGAVQEIQRMGDDEASRVLQRKLAATLPDVMVQLARVSGDRFTLLLKEDEAVKLRKEVGASPLERWVTDLLRPESDQ